MSEIPSQPSQKLARSLALRLLDETVARFSQLIDEHGAIPHGWLVSGTREACTSLEKVGALVIKRKGYTTPVQSYDILASRLQRRQFSQSELNWLIYGMCHMWFFFLSEGVKYGTPLRRIDSKLIDAFEEAGFIELNAMRPYWSTRMLPWLVESRLAGVDAVLAASEKAGTAILAAMPSETLGSLSRLDDYYAHIVLCKICSNWDGFNWRRSEQDFIPPEEGWKLQDAKAALNLLNREKPAVVSD